MPQKKYYNPQDDVVQIVDGKRMPVQAYDMYQAMHADPMQSAKRENPGEESTQEGKNKPRLSLRFDGQNLTLVEDRGDITTEYRFPAVSGRPGGEDKNTFTYSKERQYLENVGPIPEGSHVVALETAKYWKNLETGDKLKSLASPLAQALHLGKSGAMPGGPVAWGEGFVDIKLDPRVKESTGRSGMTIHGGKYPGSAGCIDLVNNDKKFFETLERLKGDQTEIPLTVDYSQTPEKVHFPKKAKK